MLAGTGEIVMQEQPDMGAGLVLNFPDADIGMVDRQIRAGGKAQAEQTPGGGSLGTSEIRCNSNGRCGLAD